MRFYTIISKYLKKFLHFNYLKGKTIAAELAMFRVFTQSDQAKADAAAKKQQVSGKKCVYIAPLKALVRERMEDWKIRLEAKLGKKVVELTGDTAPDMRAIELADVIVTTPEKWGNITITSISLTAFFLI